MVVDQSSIGSTQSIIRIKMLNNAYGYGEKSFESYSASCCKQVLLDKMPIQCHTLLLPAHVLSGSSSYLHHKIRWKF
jgi:hypothetical protein